ncbi:MAG: helix-turn-helix domain-containing protein [Caldilineaceae bacterium]|nr:helix-turn-helix domain-containing protein [Caldilineaceae bacterium]
MALYVQHLDRHKLQQLYALTNEQEEEVPENRVQIVLLSAEGLSVPEISRRVNLHPINVRKWIHRYRQHGVDGLRSGKSPGRPRLFGEQERRRILTIANADPRSLGLPFSRWSLQRLRNYLIEQGAVKHISVETIRQILQTADAPHNRRLHN